MFTGGRGRGGSEAPVADCVSGMPAAHALGAAMSELARTLQHEHASEHATLEAVTAAAVEAVPGAEHAAISLVVRGKTVQSHAGTDPLADRIDARQTELDQGPCLDAVWQQESVHIPDMVAESRWPRFTAAAVEAGIGAMLCFQLFVTEGRLGALNLYASQAGAFDEEARFTGLIFATHAAVAIIGARQEETSTHAAVAIIGARQEETLSVALAHRDVIGQAKGIVMERFHLDAPRAFALLARLSQTENIKLHDIATQLVADVADSPAAPPRRLICSISATTASSAANIRMSALPGVDRPAVSDRIDRDPLLYTFLTNGGILQRTTADALGTHRQKARC